MSRGVIYIAVNSAMPGLVKVGRSARTIEERMTELSDATGVPGKFVAAYWFEVSDMEQAEIEIHVALAKFRYERNREFFRLDTPTAIRACQEFEWRQRSVLPESCDIIMYCSEEVFWDDSHCRKSKIVFGWKEANEPRTRENSLSGEFHASRMYRVNDIKFSLRLLHADFSKFMINNSFSNISRAIFIYFPLMNKEVRIDRRAYLMPVKDAEARICSLLKKHELGAQGPERS